VADLKLKNPMDNLEYQPNNDSVNVMQHALQMASGALRLACAKSGMYTHDGVELSAQLQGPSPQHKAIKRSRSHAATGQDNSTLASLSLSR
jgi:hypothetical protein